MNRRARRDEVRALRGRRAQAQRALNEQMAKDGKDRLLFPPFGSFWDRVTTMVAPAYEAGGRRIRLLGTEPWFRAWLRSQRKGRAA